MRLRHRPTLVLAWLISTLLGSVVSRADYTPLPDPPPRTTDQKLQPVPNLDRSAITVSGLSSGGFMAHQFHIAYSKLVTALASSQVGRSGVWRPSPTHTSGSGSCRWIGSRRRPWPVATT